MWIDRHGSLGHGENSYDNWVIRGKPRDTIGYPSLFYRGVALDGREDTEHLRRWIDQHGTLRGYDHWLKQRNLYLLTESLLRLDRISPREWAAKRQQLIRFIWRGAGFPATKTPHVVVKDISDTKYAGFDNLASIERVEVRMEFGVNSIIYLFHPRRPSERLLIYHAGHNQGFSAGRDTIQFFLRHGYAVAGFAMPLTGMNNRPLLETPSGTIPLQAHSDLRILESDDFSPMRFFVEPIPVFLNYVMGEYGYGLVAMVGLSGGGWTTTLAAALEPRITRSYPVAGTLPLYFKDFAFGRDYEQHHPGLYALANYPELYVLGTYGDERRQIQVLNRYDPCCFAGTGYVIYEEQVARTAQRIGPGSFTVFLDETHREHKVSDAALAVILSDLERP